MSHFYCVFSSTSRNRTQGLRFTVALHSDSDIIELAGAECRREGVDAPETLAGAVEKLADDGREFTIYPDDEAGRSQFLEHAIEVGLRSDARSLLDLPEHDEFDGFERGDDGRYWNADATLGLVEGGDGEYSLLDSEGHPASHTLPADHAAHILAVAEREGFDADKTIRLWDYYAT